MLDFMLHSVVYFCHLEVHGDDFVDLWIFILVRFTMQECQSLFLSFLISNLYSFDAKKFRFCVVLLDLAHGIVFDTTMSILIERCKLYF